MSGEQQSRVVGRPFPKGQSGNPSGRPKVVRTMQEMAREHGDEAIKAILALARGSSDDRVKLAAWREILDRAYGKPTQHVEADIRTDVAAVLEARRQRAEIEQEEP